MGQWIADNPELAKTIGLLVTAIDGLLVVGGSLLLIMGSVAAAAAATAALGIALGPVSVIALAIIGLSTLVITLTGCQTTQPADSPTVA